MGFRAEDARLIDRAKPPRARPAGGLVSAAVDALEMLGDATVVTVRAGDTMVAVKAPKDYRATIGDQIHIQISEAACHLFDGETGIRLDSRGAN